MSTQNVLSERNLDPKAFADCIVHNTVRVCAAPRYCIHAYADDGVLVEEVGAGGGLLLGGSLFNDAAGDSLGQVRQVRITDHKESQSYIFSKGYVCPPTARVSA